MINQHLVFAISLPFLTHPMPLTYHVRLVSMERGALVGRVGGAKGPGAVAGVLTRSPVVLRRVVVGPQ
jgi:hypothetical protein